LSDRGGGWRKMKTALSPRLERDRASFAGTPFTSGHTRMYVGDGNSSVSTTDQARLFRTNDAVHATNANFTNLTTLQQASSAPNQTLDYCGDAAVGAQCRYDSVVY